MKIPYRILLAGPALMFATGFLMNAIVMAFNNGQMPVLAPGGCTAGVVDFVNDPVHSCMTHATHLKFLADWIVINNYGIASLGDFLEWGSHMLYWPALFLWALLMVNEHNKHIFCRH